MWNGTAWTRTFYVNGLNGQGTLGLAGNANISGTTTTGSLKSAGNVSVGQNSLSAGATQGAITNSLPKVSGTVAVNSALPLVWAPYGPCSTQTASCVESGLLSFATAIKVLSWRFSLLTPPSGCNTPGVLGLEVAGSPATTVSLVNGTTAYSATGMPVTVPAGSSLQIQVVTPATGCTTAAVGVESNLVYAAVD